MLLWTTVQFATALPMNAAASNVTTWNALDHARSVAVAITVEQKGFSVIYSNMYKFFMCIWYVFTMAILFIFLALAVEVFDILNA